MGETEPVFRQTDYYSTLDSVRFTDDLTASTIGQNVVSAAGTVMLGLLVGDTRPVLTQSQAFDSAYLLNVVAAGNDATGGFLELVRDGTIQVRFHEPALRDAEERYTVLNAFASALEQPRFILSGWPEINADHALRSELARAVQRIKDHRLLLNEVRDTAGPDVAGKMNGLLRLSRAVQEAGTPSLTTPAEPGTYRAAVIGLITYLRARRPDTEDLVRWLLERAAEPDDAGVDLDTRSGWRQLLRIYLGRHPAEVAQVASVERRCDYAMHHLIGTSLRWTGQEVDLQRPDDASESAGGFRDDDVPVNRLVHLSRDSDRAEWLTWDMVPGLWRQLQAADLSPAERLERLVQRHKDTVFEQRVGGGRVLTFATEASVLVPMLAGDAVQNYVAGNWTHAAGSAIAAITGLVTVVLASRGGRVTSELRAFLLSQEEARWEASISGGTASWQDEIGS
jgi:hypothetical protein